MKSNQIIWDEEIAREIAAVLIANGVYSVDFVLDKSLWTKLPDGTITPCYCNCRYLNRNINDLKMVINFMETVSRLKFKDIQLIVGLATAGIPLAALLADRLDLPLSYVRSNTKGYGQGKLVECRPPRGAKALLIDDLLYTGASLKQSIEALNHEYDIQAVGTITIVSLSSWDCQENNWSFFAERQMSLYALTSYEYLLDELIRQRRINKNQYQQLLNFYSRPKTYEWK